MEVPPDILAEDDNVEEEEEDEEENTVTCLFHSGGRLGAACYHSSTSSLFVMADVDDLGPDFKLARAMLHQTNPRRVLLSSRQTQDFAKVVSAVCGCTEEEDPGDESSTIDEESTETVSESADTRDLHFGTKDAALRNAQHLILPAKDFDVPACKRRLLNLRLQQELDEVDLEYSEDDRFILVNSLVDLGAAESCVRAAGALLKHIEETNSNCVVLSIRSLSIDEVVRIDETTLSALQIFNSSSQPSGCKFGSWNRQREGLSMFSILNRCRSVLGARYLRYMCRCPPRNLDVIAQRQEAVSFFADPSHRDLAKYLQDCLKQVKNVPKILKKMATMQATVKDWKCLKITVSNLLLIHEACSAQQENDVEIFHCLQRSVTQDLRSLADFITGILDVEESEAKSRFTVKAGVDDELDEKRRLHNGLSDLLVKVAEEDILELPSFMTECVMVYVPHVGYLLAVQPWREGLQEEDFGGFADLEYMFCSDTVPHFKTRRCRELDDTLGDTANNIIEHETRIMVRLTKYVLHRSESILAPMRYSALLDCLLALAAVTVESGWTRPQMIPSGGLINIQGGRHPLQETCSVTFVPNPTHFEENRKLVVLTGPNACGKSIYLKQVGLIVFLAHLGSWVPAQSAAIPLVDQIHTRIRTLESLSLGLSAFAVDLNQMSLALASATESSLLLIDEFGKGTSEIDGQALLYACLEFLLCRTRPFLLVSTHFQNVRSMLKAYEQWISFMTFEYMFHGMEIVFLYRLKEGLSTDSHARVVARAAGIDDSIIKRSTQILKCITQGGDIQLNEEVYPINRIEDAVERFMTLELEDAEKVGDFFRELKNSDGVNHDDSSNFV